MSFSCKKGEFDQCFSLLDRPVEESRLDRQPDRSVDPTGFHLWAKVLILNCLRAIWPKEPPARKSRKSHLNVDYLKQAMRKSCLPKGFEPAAFRLPVGPNLPPGFRVGSL